MAADSGASSPALQGYTTAGEEVQVTSAGDSSGNETTVEFPIKQKRPAKRTLRSRSASFKQRRDSRGRFLPYRREHTDVSDDDSVSSLTHADSLIWDNHQQPLLNETVGTRRWSVETQHGVLVPDYDLVDERLRLLPPHPEGRESAASGSVEQLSVTMENVNDVRDRVERALLEIEDDILPFQGRQMTNEKLVSLTAKATSVRRILQDSHLYLAAHDGEEYEANLKGAVATNRRALSAFIVEMEEQLAKREADTAASEATKAANLAAQQAAVGVAAERDRLAARQELIRSRAARLLGEAGGLEEECKAFCAAGAASDEQLYERVENHKVICGRLDITLEECKSVANQALEHDLIKESSDVDLAVSCLRKLKQQVDRFILSSRRDAGVWTEKGRRAAARGDLKMPTFSGAMSDKLTVYKFEKEWVAYRAAVNYSVEEALKELKLAVQQPARAAVQKMTNDEMVFKYLKAHYGNPVLLLNAREEEMRAWADCKGTDVERREWLINAKDRLEATVHLCEEHKISKYMHFSSIAAIVQSKLPADMIRDFKKILVKHLSPSGVLEKEIIIGLLIDFVEEKILDCTLGVNLDIVSFLGASQPEEKKTEEWKHKKQDVPKYQRQEPRADQRKNQQNHSQHSQNQQQGAGAQNSHQGQRVDPHKCAICGEDHPALYYCEEYIKAKVSERFDMVKFQKTCARCLTMGRKFTGKKSDWWQAHDRYCKTAFACKEGQCAGKPRDRQLHMTVCFTHVTENRKREAEFVKTLDNNRLPGGLTQSNIRFLHMLGQPVYNSAQWPLPGSGQAVSALDADGFEIIPDVGESGLFLMQMLPAESDLTKELLCFYDSGCAAAGLSDRAYSLMKTTTVRDGPTVLEVAGAKSILIPYGEEQFHLELDEKKQKATVTGLRMPNITAEFPLVQLAEAWKELQLAAAKDNKKVPYMKADSEVGGQCVDIILGIKYLKYYPELVFSLPSGLSVYKARLKSASGCQAILGGPHAAWTAASSRAQHMNPRVYLTAEARAWYTEQKWVVINQDKFSKMVDSDQEVAEVISSIMVDDQKELKGCDHCHCDESGGQHEMYNVATLERRLWQVEQLGTESPYRCVACRSCSKCRKGDTLEAISFKEEAEQALIEQSVQLDPSTNTLWATLPFIEDPQQQLKPNRFIAEKVLKAQLDLFTRNPGMRDDTIKSHQKLVDKGHVISEKELTKEYREAMGKLPGEGYFIPWRTVYNDGSLSTPCRLVFDASSKTPGGESLNGVLAKGQNRLAKLQHLLMRFRLGKEAVTADISMAYNGTKLRPEHLKFQKYLWRKDLNPANPTEVRFVATLIYGVKPSGQQCQVALEKLADYFQANGECMDGACALKDDTYVNDIITSQSSKAECEAVAEEVKTILVKGSMGVKAFSLSG